MNKRNLGIIYTVSSALIYGFVPIICALSYYYGNNAFSLTFFRSFITLPIFGLICLRKNINLKISLRDFIHLLIVSFFGIVTAVFLLYLSYNYIGVGSATTLHFLYPLFVMMIAHLIYHDKISAKQKKALFLAMIGIAFFFDYRDLNKLLGVVIALLSGVCFSIYIIGLDKFRLSKMDNYKLSFYLSLNVVVIMGAINLFVKQIIFNQPLNSYIYILIVALLAQFIGLIMFKMGVDYLGGTEAAILSLFEPISAVIFGVLFLGERVSLPQIVGCLFIIVGVLLLVRKKV